MKLPPPKSGAELLDMYYLEIRSHLLETAAALDRIERARGGDALDGDPRLTKLKSSLEILAGPGTDRTKRFLELFSVDGSDEG